MTQPELAVHVKYVGRMYRWLGQELGCNPKDERALKQLAKQGLLVHSVTGVLNVMAKGQGLFDWYAKMGAEAMLGAVRNLGPEYVLGRPEKAIEWAKEAPSRNRDARGAHGDIVHDAIERIILGQPIEVELTEGQRNAIRAFERFAVDFDLNPESPELSLFGEDNGKRWAGTADCMGTVQGDRAVIDWKTNRKGLKPEVRFQLASLSRCRWAAKPGEHWEVDAPTVGIALHLDEDGSYNVAEVADMEGSWAVWRSLLDVWETYALRGHTWDGWRSPLKQRIPTKPPTADLSDSAVPDAPTP